MFEDILEKILKNAEDIYDDIIKSKSAFNDIYYFTLYDFTNINKDKIDKIKERHIENVKYFLNYISLLDIFNNNMNFEQLDDILNDDDLQIFKIKNLFDKDISEYICKTEKEIIDEISETIDDLDIINKIDFYCDLYNNKLVKEYMNLIKNKDKDINNNNSINLIDDKIYYTEEYNEEHIEEYSNRIDELMKQFITNDINVIKIDDNMAWNDNVILYKLENKNKNDIYIYFDIYYRKSKTDMNNIIQIKDNIYCINKLYYKLDDDNITDLKTSIEKCISII